MSIRCPLIHIAALAVFVGTVFTGVASPGRDDADTADQNAPQDMRPEVAGPWWTVAGNPDLGKYTSEKQQPVDFSVWQAADGTWQLWSCIRGTKCGGTGRVFHGWEGKSLTDANWRPLGITMEADPKVGETPGGLQAPHVVKFKDQYYMLYGDWEHICLATSRDGKKFSRYIQPNGKTGLFTEGLGTNTRDIVALRIGDLWYGYYTAFPADQGAVYCRTSPDLKTWSESTTVAFGGRAGVNRYAAECPHVVEHDGRYYLFRTQKYGQQARTSVYRSTDPMNFGINQDRRYFVCELAVAAPEIVRHEGQDYIAALLPSLKGIQIARLQWAPSPVRETVKEAIQ
jgi:Glycosyl hydrolases family 43